jgi:hypothetical protein
MLQAAATQTPATPAPAPVQLPAPIAPSPPPAITGQTGLVFRVPTTQEAVEALREMRSELSNQLQSAAGRREELAEEMLSSAAGARPGLQARIDLLDARILKIEADIATTGDLLAQARGTPGLESSPTPPPFRNMRPDMTAISIVFTIFVMMPIAVSIARSIWRKGSVSKVETQIERENAERLTRLEQSIDTIAVEVERISEGQRFVTKLLAESQTREKQLLERGNG